MKSSKKTIDLIKRRQAVIASGNINSIPIPLERFTRYGIPGIEQETYYLVTANTKVGKSQITAYMFIFQPLLYAYNNNTDVDIFYVALEETEERITARFISYMLYLLYNKVVDYRTLMSSNNIALSNEILNLIQSNEMQDYLKFYDEHVHFIEDRNPTGVYNILVKHAEENGTIHYKEVKSKDEFGTEVERKVFHYYVPNNPHKFTLFIIDHISIMSLERGFNKMQNISKMSEYCVELRNRYKFSPVVVQQQNDNEGTDNFKMHLTRPTLQGLRDGKDTSRDCNICLALYSPFKYKEATCLGYDISILKDKFRLLEVLASRDGNAGTVIGLEFMGSISHFKELPKPNTPEMEEVYNRIAPSKEAPKEQGHFVFFNYNFNSLYGQCINYFRKIR